MKASKIKRESKAQILNRMIQSKEMLLEWGFNATFIETEDIHLARRAKDTDFEHKIRQWIETQNKNDGEFVPPAIQSEVKERIKQIQERTQNVIEVEDRRQKLRNKAKKLKRKSIHRPTHESHHSSITNILSIIPKTKPKLKVK